MAPVGNIRASRRVKRGQTVAVAAGIVALLAAIVPLSGADAASEGWTVTASPSTVRIGANSKGVTFTFATKATASGVATLVVPSGPGWSAPQRTNPAGAGFTAVKRGSCKSASLVSITGKTSGPWTVAAKVSCSAGKSFSIVYGAGTGTTKLTAPTVAGAVGFATKFKKSGSTVSKPVVPTPLVRVAAGPATRFTVAGLVSGPVGVQHPTVTARDAYGNVATGYRGTVEIVTYCEILQPSLPGTPGINICITDPPALLPGDYTFTAADRGVHTFAVTIRGANPFRSLPYPVVATDTAKPSITGKQYAYIVPGPTTHFDVKFANQTLAPGQLLTKSPLNVIARDQFGNQANDNSTVSLAYSPPANLVLPTLVGTNPMSLTLDHGEGNTYAYPFESTTPGLMTTVVAAKAGGVGGYVQQSVLRVAPNLDPTEPGGYEVQPDNSVVVNAPGNIIQPTVTVPAGATFTINAVLETPTGLFLTTTVSGGATGTATIEASTPLQPIIVSGSITGYEGADPSTNLVGTSVTITPAAQHPTVYSVGTQSGAISGSSMLATIYNINAVLTIP